MLPEGQGIVTISMRECNWLQGLEGDIDTSHFGFLHAGAIDPDEMPGSTFSRYVVGNRAPNYAVLTRDYGTMYGAYRPAEADSYYWRIAHFVFPFFTFTPPGPLGAKVAAGAWVPIDDEHTHQLAFRQIAPGLILRAGGMLPRTTSPYGRFRFAANWENDYQIEREVQRSNRGPDGYTGIKGVLMQDQAVTESMGPIYDRSQEHLASGDSMIIRTRRRLLDAALALAQNGQPAPCVDEPDAWLQRSGGIVLPRDADFVEATEDLRTPFVAHPEIDVAATLGPIPAA
jgi:hypothetical protein